MLILYMYLPIVEPTIPPEAIGEDLTKHVIKCISPLILTDQVNKYLPNACPWQRFMWEFDFSGAFKGKDEVV